jgi:hypothetical protein
MNTISDIANKSNRKLYMNHLSSLAKLREARLRIEELETALKNILIHCQYDYPPNAKAIILHVNTALGDKKDDN